MPVDAQINELYAWHGHITKLNGKNTIILMNDRTMYSLVFRNRLPRNAICVARGYSLAELEAMRANKAEKRGGFKEKIFLEYVEEKR